MNNTEKNILENQTHRIDWTIHSHTITSFLSDNSIRFVIHNSFLEKLTDLFSFLTYFSYQYYTWPSLYNFILFFFFTAYIYLLGVVPRTTSQVSG